MAGPAVLEFRKRLRELRERKKLTRAQLERQLKWGENSIGRLEGGAKGVAVTKTGPDVDQLATLCRFFEVTSDQMIGLEDLLFPELVIPKIPPDQLAQRPHGETKPTKGTHRKRRKGVAGSA